MSAADPARIEAFLGELAQIGRDGHAGWSRMAFSAAERRAHELFTGWLEGYGLQVATDPVGNTIATLPGSQDRLPALVTGSHLDTVYQGGNYDGAVGVAAAVELARLAAEDGRWRHPLRVVAFTAEEGARFGTPCIGSRLITGAFGPAELRAMTDRDGISAYAAAQAVGLRPAEAAAARWNFTDVACFIEVHIEQGRVLEARDRPIGVVHSIGGSTRVELTFSGRADHSGATPMWLRRDALVTAAEFVLAVDRRARQHPTTVATVGRLDVDPNSLTTVPGQVVVGLDVRDIDSERQRDLAEALLDDAVRIAAGREVTVTARRLSDQSPVVLHGSVQAVLAGAAARLELPFITMPSGASHDAAHLATHTPTGMVFVPCREGISHAPVEHADPTHIARAVDLVREAFHAIDTGDGV
jgi:hydantoinase/carbamoylase family amidase